MKYLTLTVNWHAIQFKFYYLTFPENSHFIFHHCKNSIFGKFKHLLCLDLYLLTPYIYIPRLIYSASTMRVTHSYSDR